MTWALAQIPNDADQTWYWANIAFGNEIFMAIRPCCASTRKKIISSSDNGKTWNFAKEMPEGIN